MSKSLFKKSDYNSSDGMLTTIWGPGMWHFLHTMSFNYPVKPTAEQKTHYKNYIYSLQKVLPCKYCRDNYFNNLKMAGISGKSFKSRTTFSRFIYKLHESVNKMLGKKSGLSYKEVKDRYEHFRSRCLNDDKIAAIQKARLEKGCTEPLYGKKSKCILKIVPSDEKIETFKMSAKCKIKRLCNKK